MSNQIKKNFKALRWQLKKTQQLYVDHYDDEALPHYDEAL